MPDFLLELLSEEIPARMQGKAQQDLARLFSEQLSNAGLAAERVDTYATPRRLALIARGLPAETAAVREETKGPRTSAPPQALEGFLRKTGLARDQLEERDGVLFAVVDKPGRATCAVLAEAVPALFRAFPWPKSMRWGAASTSTESPRWVRPLQNIVALLGEEIVEFDIAGIRSGAATLGHRFHHPGIITLGGAHDYLEKLLACHVVVDPAERRRIVAVGARAAAAAAGLALVEDEGLVAENGGLTEWPVPLLGRFDPDFLQVPREVIQLTMRTNQKYFACTDGEGNLAPNFVCTANIEATDGGASIVAGNERVLSARLSDAKFFWEQDLKVPLEDQAKKLSDIVFHEKLGTVADKVERVAKLARWLVEEGIVGGGTEKQKSVRVERSRDTLSSEAEDSGAVSLGSARQDPSTSLGANGYPSSLAAQAERAARLCKADLVTQMVGEFPELQGLIGGHLASAQGEDPAVADAVRDHYKPVGQGDEVPSAPVTVAVSLADKLDSLVGFFQAGEKPTGSKDPFALRRAALGILSLIIDNGIRATMFDLISAAAHRGGADAGRELAGFLIERLKVQQRECGIRHDMIDAVVAVEKGGDNVRMVRRVRALQAFVETPEGADLLAGYKRAANILKKENYPVIPAKAGTSGQEVSAGLPEVPASAAMSEQAQNKTLSYTPETEETALIVALDSAQPRAVAAVEAEDFEGAMAALASLRAPVDAFFDKVIVNDPDPDKREARLALLARMRDSVHRVADFSRIEG
ncbi:MAG: glycyl-tRNA synthetase beta chain [Sphingomonadales bacterium]|jgi:glycyl-tRNA synthetase beta chain|nr:glycyl-tRNA synthetase beta chain [Sphingomonadales bacterium]